MRKNGQPKGVHIEESGGDLLKRIWALQYVCRDLWVRDDGRTRGRKYKIRDYML